MNDDDPMTVGNAIISRGFTWVVPTFQKLNHIYSYKSAAFKVIYEYGQVYKWHLSICAMKTENSWEPLKVRFIIQERKTQEGHPKKIKFGLRGYDAEIAVTREFKHLSMEFPLVPRSLLDDEKDIWLGDKHLRLFFKVDFEETLQNQTEPKIGIGKLLEDFKKIMVNEGMSDVVVTVQGKEYKCHQCILAARSPVLKKMLAEMKENNSTVITIPDTSIHTFTQFLSFLYSGSVDKLSENALELYITAEKYRVNELKEFCIDHIMNNITVNGFCDVLNLSLDLGREELVDACTTFYAQNTLDIISTSKWELFVKENPIESNKLHKKMLQMQKLKR